MLWKRRSFTLLSRSLVLSFVFPLTLPIISSSPRSSVLSLLSFCVLLSSPSSLLSPRHGVVPIHALLWAAFCDQYLRDHTTGRTLYGTGAAPDIAMYLPFLRNWLGCLGAGKGASYEALKEGLRTDHLHVLSGGAAEIFEAEPGRCTVVLENRRGLVQLALKTGAELVPCYVFGGDDFFCSLATVDSDSNVLARLCKTLVGNRLPVFWGYLGLPLPFLCTVTACVSAPIPVSKKVGESDAQCIARCHGEYVEAVRGLFEKYKEVSGHGGDVLQVK